MSLVVDHSNEFTFAKSLVCPDKNVRDQTLMKVKSYLSSSKDMDDIEMLKLWKSLYYCLWLSDKQDIQLELLDSLVNLFDIFPTRDLSFLYLQMFFRTIVREWAMLDQYRVDKFYRLIRKMFRKALETLLSLECSENHTSVILNILELEVLTKRPNGIRFHIADVLLPELVSLTGGKVQASKFMAVVDILLQALIRGDDSTFGDRIVSSVFTKFISDYAAENRVSVDDSTLLFSPVITLTLQKRLFDLAADEKTPESARRKLYALHKMFSLKSSHPFVNDQTISALRDNESKIETSSTSISADCSKTPVSKPQKNRKDKTHKNELISVNEDVDIPHNKKRRVTNVAEGNVDDSSQCKLSAEDTTDETSAQFIACKKFSGQRKGFVFQMGVTGLGYYKDKIDTMNSNRKLSAKKGGIKSK